MRSRTIALLALVFLIVTPAMAAPPPRPVCEPCGSGFSESATWYGETRGVENETTTGVAHSTATVRVYGNETAVWTVENRLTSERAVRFFRENPAALLEVADNAEHFGGKTLLSARVVGNDTIVLRYRSDEQVTRTRGGVLRFDGFREVRGKRFSGLGADELTVVGPSEKLTVVGPSETTITRAPSEATVRANELTLTSLANTRGEGSFVTFAQSGGVVGEAWSFVSVWESLADDVIRNLLLDVLLPAVSLLALLVGFVRVSGKTIERDERIAKLFAGIVTVLGIFTLLFGFVELSSRGSFGSISSILIAGGAYTALALLTFIDVSPTLPRVATGVFLAWLVGITVMGVSAIAVNSYVASELLALNYYAVSDFAFAGFASLFLLSMAVVGYAVSDPRYRRVAILLPPTILAVTLAVVRPITHVRTPLDFMFSLLFVALVLVAVSLFGIPVFLLGRTIPSKK